MLKDLSLRVEEGEFLTVMGPSGSGKSTLLHIIGLLDRPDEGAYRFRGGDALAMKEKERTKLHQGSIGFVFQAYHLIDNLTVAENIEAPLLYRGLGGAERRARVADMLDRFGLAARKNLFPEQLSGGQQQLVGVIRALIGSPALILADEPTGNLASTQSDEVMELFRRINREEGITIIQVTHNERCAAYGNRTIHLLDGQIQKDTAL